jgi:NifU-like protein involved in Fe-S cluster formation
VAELEDIYSERIMTLAANSQRARRLTHPDATATAHSKLCGSTVTVDLNMQDDVITDYGQTVKACLLGQSSAAVVAANIVGSTASEMRRIGAEMRRMLKENGPPPSGRWHDLEALEPVREVKARHTSTLLVFDAVERAIAEIEEKRKSGATT